VDGLADLPAGAPVDSPDERPSEGLPAPPPAELSPPVPLHAASTSTSATANHPAHHRIPAPPAQPAQGYQHAPPSRIRAAVGTDPHQVTGGTGGAGSPSHAVGWTGPVGDIRLTAAVREGRLRLSVADEGAGFPPGFLPQAFDRFTRAEASRTTPGSGLGLAFVAAVAASHNGTARAENTAHGTVVTIDIPS
jgi:hypothetical protein